MPLSVGMSPIRTAGARLGEGITLQPIRLFQRHTWWNQGPLAVLRHIPLDRLHHGPLSVSANRDFPRSAALGATHRQRLAAIRMSHDFHRQ
jgi:hypothetical protein